MLLIVLSSVMPKKTSLTLSSKNTLTSLFPENCNKEFLEYLKLDQDECPDQNQKFLEYLKTGLITIDYEHLLLALKNGHIQLLEGILGQLNFFEKTSVFSYNKKSKEKYNLLHYLADKKKLSLRLRDNPEKISKIADLLLKNKVEINHIDRDGKTPLILAVQLENEALFSSLLKQPLVIVSHFDFSEKNALDYAFELANSKKSNQQEYLKSVSFYFVKLLQANILIINHFQDKLDDKLFQQQLDKIDLILDIVFDRRVDLKIDDFDKLTILSSIISKPYNSVITDVLCFDPSKMSTKYLIEDARERGVDLKFLERIFKSEYFKKLSENFELYRDKFYDNFLLYEVIYDLNYDLFEASDALLEGDELVYEGDTKIYMSVLENFFSPNSAMQFYLSPAEKALKVLFKREDSFECLKELFSKVYDPNYNVKRDAQAKNLFYWGFLSNSLDGMPKTQETYLRVASLVTEVDFAYYNFFNIDKKQDFYMYFLPIYHYNNQFFVSKNNGTLIIPLFRPDQKKDPEITSVVAYQVIERAYIINKKVDELKLVSYRFLDEMSHKDIFDFALNIEKQYYGKTDLVDFEISIDSSMFYNSSVGLVSYRGEYREGKFHGKGVLEFQHELMKNLKNYIAALKTSLKNQGLDAHDQVVIAKCLEKFEGFFEKPYQRYIGEFKNGLFHGQGYLEMTDGSIYEGQFKDGKFHGIGEVFTKKPQGIIHEFEAKFKEGKIFVSTKANPKALTDVMKPSAGLKRLADFNSKGIDILEVDKSQEKSSQLDFKESLLVARFVGDKFVELFNLELKNKLENELKFLNLKEELSSLTRALEFLELKLRENEAILEIKQSTKKLRISDEYPHLRVFENEGQYLEMLSEKKKRIIKENLALNSRIDRYRQHIKKLQDFIEASQEALKAGISLTRKKAEDGQAIRLEKFSEVFDFHALDKRLKLTLDGTAIIDLNQQSSTSALDDDFVSDLVKFLNEERLVEKIKQQKLSLTDRIKIQNKVTEILEINVNQELLGILSKNSQELLTQISESTPVLGSSANEEFLFLQPSKLKTKFKTRPNLKVIDVSGGLDSASLDLNADYEIDDQDTRVYDEEILGDDSQELLKARYSSQQISELWNLLCGVDLQINIAKDEVNYRNLRYFKLNDFGVGCAYIEDEKIQDLESKTDHQLKQIFHKELDNLVEKISKQCGYDHQQSDNLRSHIYIHNAYCIGGESLKDCLQKNYQKIFLEGRIVGELEGLGHARGASDDELKKSIWTIRKLAEIDEDFEKSPVSRDYLLTLQKFELSLQNKMSMMSKREERLHSRYSGHLELDISGDEDFVINLCKFFKENSIVETQPELLEVENSLIKFLKLGLNEISSQQASFKGLQEGFVNEVKRIEKISNSQEIFKELLDSQFSILEFLSKEMKDQLVDFRKFCDSKYLQINEHFNKVEDLKSRQGLRKSVARKVGSSKVRDDHSII